MIKMLYPKTETFVNNSQPYYAVLSPDEMLLNHPVGYKPNVGEYSSFLDCGLDAFKQLESLSPTERTNMVNKLRNKMASVQ